MAKGALGILQLSGMLASCQVKLHMVQELKSSRVITVGRSSHLLHGGQKEILPGLLSVSTMRVITCSRDTQKQQHFDFKPHVHKRVQGRCIA